MIEILGTHRCECRTRMFPLGLIASLSNHCLPLLDRRFLVVRSHPIGKEVCVDKSKFVILLERLAIQRLVKICAMLQFEQCADSFIDPIRTDGVIEMFGSPNLGSCEISWNSTGETEHKTHKNVELLSIGDIDASP